MSDRTDAIRFSVHLPGMFEDLRKVSNDKYRGACPMHGGDNRSGFGVNRTPRGWAWVCYTGDCGSGDAIDLVMLREERTFREALDILDGGEHGTRRESAAPVRPVGHETLAPSLLLVCDACGSESREVAGRTYGNGGSRPNFTTTALQELAHVEDWEIAPDHIACVGPKCLERIVS